MLYRIDYEFIGRTVKDKRFEIWGKNRSEFCRLLEEVTSYKWGSSNFAKLEAGVIKTGFEKLQELCIVLDIDFKQLIDDAIVPIEK